MKPAEDWGQAAVPAAAEHFTGLAMELTVLANGLWGFHVTVLLAAVGWGVASRNWSRGLSLAAAAVAGAGLFLFGLVNVTAVSLIYDRSNAAAALALSSWAETAPAKALPHLYRLYARHELLARGTLIVDLGAALLLTLLLSRLGRTTAGPAPGARAAHPPLRPPPRAPARPRRGTL
jgi:hypothetical protein